MWQEKKKKKRKDKWNKALLRVRQSDQGISRGAHSQLGNYFASNTKWLSTPAQITTSKLTNGSIGWMYIEIYKLLMKISKHGIMRTLHVEIKYSAMGKRKIITIRNDKAQETQTWSKCGKHPWFLQIQLPYYTKHVENDINLFLLMQSVVDN